MDTDLKNTCLMGFLEIKSTLYYGKIEELHNAIKEWLGYIPQTFPHYTRHTIPHSIEIIKQISALLFEGNDPTRPVINISATEAYILMAAAYLHDTGMVASDREKTEILDSEAWREWTSVHGGGARRWEEIKAFRISGKPANEQIRNFLADIQVRFLLAEFIRRSHHQRAAKIITLHQRELGRFAFDDPVLLQAIADACAAHGLSRHELTDHESFPDRRDIRGDQVNLQFLAILLRLGDLLDISYDRACPLLMNAASPLPADSLAHWTQYQRITHRLTAADKIEITAKCQNQEEHRYLRDWCQWLVDEAANAAVLKAHWKRHENWPVPIATIKGDSPTIKIQPAPGATYIFGDWKLELDHEAIFERLIYDVYDRPSAFILELIQNALDATRCRIYADCKATGQDTPEYPTQFPEEIRQKFPIKISLEERACRNELSGETETCQVLTVEDNGIGMDRDIIQKYFLQIGRSYYVTDEFRRNFKFNPTSRFGVGFLSVFSVSDLVEVETYKTVSGDGPLRLKLTGPRNYLLMDKGGLTANGTRISVGLRQPFSAGELTSLIREWCRRVEFPIVVNDLGTETTIVAERAEDFIYEIPLVTDPDARFEVRAFPINRPGIEGELYVFALFDKWGESWEAREWAEDVYPKLHPNANVPQIIESIYCINGISYGLMDREVIKYERVRSRRSGFSERIDYRKLPKNINLARKSMEFYENEVSPEVDSRWQEIMEQHLSNSLRAQVNNSWVYKQLLADKFKKFDFWENQLGTIRIFRNGESHLISLKELEEQHLITVVLRAGMVGYKDGIKPGWDNDAISIWGGDLESLSDFFRIIIFTKRTVQNMRWLDNGYFALDYNKEHCKKFLKEIFFRSN